MVALEYKNPLIQIFLDLLQPVMQCISGYSHFHIRKPLVLKS